MTDAPRRTARRSRQHKDRPPWLFIAVCAVGVLGAVAYFIDPTVGMVILGVLFFGTVFGWLVWRATRDMGLASGLALVVLIAVFALLVETNTHLWNVAKAAVMVPVLIAWLRAPKFEREDDV